MHISEGGVPCLCLEQLYLLRVECLEGLMGGHDYCVAAGCNNRRGRSSQSCAFYRFPVDPSVRTEWVRRLNRKGFSLKSVTANSYLCSEHFTGGRKASRLHLPTLFSHKTYDKEYLRPPPKARVSVAVASSPGESRRKTSATAVAVTEEDPPTPAVAECDMSSAPALDPLLATCYGDAPADDAQLAGVGGISWEEHNYFCTATPLELRRQLVELQREITKLNLEQGRVQQLSAEVATLKARVVNLELENQQLHEECRQYKFCAKVVGECDHAFHFYTGLPHYNAFRGLYSSFEHKLNCLYLFHGAKQHSVDSTTHNKRGRPRALLYEDELFLTLVRLRLGVPEEDLCFRFRLSSVSQVSSILKTWINFLAAEWSPYIVWPRKSQVKENLPEVFRHSYPDVMGIIDCSEFELQAPSSFSVQAMTYSEYKSRNTVKALFCITPDGYFSHISQLYPGSKSDNDITMVSGILDQCEPGVSLMADKGFTIPGNELHRRGITLVRPSFMYNNERASKDKVQHTKKVANARIYVENAIGRLRYYRILNHRIPVKSAHCFDQIVRVCVFLTNLLGPICWEKQLQPGD